MNLALSNDHILDDYPEQVTHTLRSGHATCVKFNRKGDYLATGRHNGTVVVWDLDTMGVARKLRGHCYAVSSLSWSADGRYLLSACQGWFAVLWDLQDGSQHRRVRFNAPVFMAELNPLNRVQFVACLYEDQPQLVDIAKEIAVKHVLPSVPARNGQDTTPEAAEKQAREDARNMTTAATFTANGRFILSGTSKGNINVIDVETRQIIHSTGICSAIITGVQTAQSSRVMLVNSKDRIIRTFKLPDFSDPLLDADSISIELEHRFQDVVNRMSWNHTTFSATGDYVIASTYNSHELYLWERNMGSLVRMLVGKTEEMGMIDWHPFRPTFAVLNLDMGVIYLWSVTIDQKWSALAPDFVEVEENVEYQEREDEFDTYPQEDINKQRLEAEDETIDILPSKRDAPDAGFVMPVCYDVGDTDSEQELVTIKPGTMRRKGSGEEDAEDAGEDKPASSAKKKGKARKR